MDMTPYIKAKSDQLNADDLVGGPEVVKIMGVKASGTKDQPVIIEIDGGHQPYKPCKSMIRVLVGAWGKDASAWVGRSMQLHCDPGVMYAGVKVGGIRITHLSDIPGDTELMLTATRGKKKPYKVSKLTVSKPAVMTEAQFAEKLPAVKQHIEAGKMTPGQAVARLEKTARLTDEQKKQVLDLGTAESGGVDFG